MKFDRTLFAERLREVIQEKLEITQVEFSKQASISEPSISSYLYCDKEPNLDTIKKICLAGGVSAVWLLGLEE